MKDKSLNDLEIKAKIDLTDSTEILEILENMLDEKKAASLLKRFNDCSKRISQLVVNRGKGKSDEQWKLEYEQAEKKLNDVIAEIRGQGL